MALCFLLTCALLMTSSHSEGQLNDATASIAADGALLVAYRTMYNCAGQPLERVGLLHSPHWATGQATKLTTDATAPLFGYLDSNEAGGRKSPLATKNLLEVTGGLRRPPEKGGRGNPSVNSRCGSPLLLRCF